MSTGRYNFWDVFQENPDGSLIPKVTMNVNGVTLTPSVALQAGVAVGGIDFAAYKNHDIAAEYIDDVFHIRGFFRKTM